jgi:acyl carrier protein
MTTDEKTLEEVQQIFRDVIDRPSLTIGRETSAKDVEDWDSLAHINLVVAIEKRFRVKFALGELQSLRNVGDMIDLIGRKAHHE